METSKLFSIEKHSEIYQQARPIYTDDLIEEIIEYWKYLNDNSNINTIVDVGCGTGQLTFKLSKYAKSVIGTDISQTQINQAIKSYCKYENITFKVGDCCDIPCDNESVDIITCAECIHWFDIEKFNLVVKRCLKRKGLLAIITYKFDSLEFDNKKVESQLNELLEEITYSCENGFGSFILPQAHWVNKFLEGIKLPFENTFERRDNKMMYTSHNIDSFGNVMRSWSFYQSWKKENASKVDPIQQFIENTKKIFKEHGLEENIAFRVKCPLSLILDYKP